MKTKGELASDFVDAMFDEQGPYFVRGYLKSMLQEQTEEQVQYAYDHYRKFYAQKETV